MTAFMYATPSGMQSLARMPEKLWRRSARWTESAIGAGKRSTIRFTQSRKIPLRPEPVPRGSRAGHAMGPGGPRGGGRRPRSDEWARPIRRGVEHQRVREARHGPRVVPEERVQAVEVR